LQRENKNNYRVFWPNNAESVNTRHISI